jgi:hypothetical protein
MERPVIPAYSSLQLISVARACASVIEKKKKERAKIRTI